MKIEIGKYYKTRHGKKVRIYALDGQNDDPTLFGSVHGAYIGADGGWLACEWGADGKDPQEEDSFCDIVSEWDQKESDSSSSKPDRTSIAIMVLSGLCANPAPGIKTELAQKGENITPGLLAKISVEIADKLVEELNANHPNQV